MRTCPNIIVIVDERDDERVLKDFDLDYTFGPSYGEGFRVTYSHSELHVYIVYHMQAFPDWRDGSVPRAWA